MITTRKDRRKLVPVRNNPGIYKIFEDRNGKLVDTGRFLVSRRRMMGSVTKREKAVFTNLEDARSFKAGALTKPVARGIKPVRLEKPENDGLSFGQLVNEWKDFHYMRIHPGTQLLYDRKLPALNFLNEHTVESLRASSIDELVTFWVREYPKTNGRQSFDKELTLLTVILNFYKSRRNAAFVVPVRRDHYEAATLTKRPSQEVAALSEEELKRFFKDLKTSSGNPLWYPLAVTQYGLSLRIAEACALQWDDFDFEKREVHIRRRVWWNDRTWEAKLMDGTKNGKTRRLVLPDFLVPVLQKLYRERNPNEKLVFHKNGEILNRKSVATAYNRSLKRIGVTDVSGTHMIRRTAGTHANDATGDVFAVQELMDHSSTDITKRYVKRLSSQKKKVADALNNVLRNCEDLEPTPPAESVVTSAIEAPRHPVPHQPQGTGGPRFKLIVCGGGDG